MSHGLARVKLVFEARPTSGQTLTHSGYRKLALDSPSTNLGHFTISADVLTCVIPGTYLVAGSIYQSTHTRMFSWYFSKNTGNPSLARGCQPYSPYSQRGNKSCMVVFDLAVGDTLDNAVYPYTNSIVTDTAGDLVDRNYFRLLLVAQ